MYNVRLDIFRIIYCKFTAIFRRGKISDIINCHEYTNEKEIEVTIVASKINNKFRVLHKEATNIEYTSDEEIFRHAGLVFSKCKYCGKMQVNWVRYFHTNNQDKVKELYPKEV